MTVKTILWKYIPRKDGSCNLKIYVSHENQKKYIKTDLHIHPKYFDEKKGEVKTTYPNHKRYNSKLQKLKREIEDRLLDGLKLDNLGKEKKTSLIVFLKDYIQDILSGYNGLSKGTAKNYQSLLTRLEQYKKHASLSDIRFEDIDLIFYEDYKRFLMDHCGAGLPGFGKHIKVLKTIMRLGMDAGLHNNEVFRNKLFKRYKSQPGNKIYLTEEEITSIQNLDLSNDKTLERERDRFLVSYFFLMRFDDSRNIKKESFFEQDGKHYLKYQQQKTGIECIVPVKPEAWDILNKRDFNFDQDSNPEANRKLKLIAALAKVDAYAKEGSREGPKWKFVTTHTARRSAATNLALQNVSIKIIADLGGWKKIDTLRIYLRASGLDTARIAKDLDFFL